MRFPPHSLRLDQKEHEHYYHIDQITLSTVSSQNPNLSFQSGSRKSQSPTEVLQSLHPQLSRRSARQAKKQINLRPEPGRQERLTLTCVSDEGDNKYGSCGQYGRDHQNTEPSDVKTVFGASYPVAEATPQACTFASL